MREVIEKMLEIERRARRIVAKAEAQAARTTDEARAASRQTVEAARQQALAQVDTIVRKVVAQAEEEKEARLAEVRQRCEAEKGKYMEHVSEVAEQLLPLLVGTSLRARPAPAPPSQHAEVRPGAEAPASRSSP
jgi:vacuolar-type H+-ATPase subunit H